MNGNMCLEKHLAAVSVGTCSHSVNRGTCGKVSTGGC
jgi:hypothetical protein